jgi:hypothetical protein
MLGPAAIAALFLQVRGAGSLQRSSGLDPCNDPQGWIQAARNLQSPLTVVLADQGKSIKNLQGQRLR